MFIKARIRNYKIVHGFNDQNEEIVEEGNVTDWSDKIFALSRIQSITERYLRMTYSHERVIYWEYEGGLKNIVSKLKAADQILEE